MHEEKKSINHRAIDKCCSSSIIGHQMNYKCADRVRAAAVFWFLLYHATISVYLSQSECTVKNEEKINLHSILVLPKSRHFNYNNNNNTINLCPPFQFEMIEMPRSVSTATM